MITSIGRSLIRLIVAAIFGWFAYLGAFVFLEISTLMMNRPDISTGAYVLFVLAGTALVLLGAWGMSLAFSRALFESPHREQG